MRFITSTESLYIWKWSPFKSLPVIQWDLRGDNYCHGGVFLPTDLLHFINNKISIGDERARKVLTDTAGHYIRRLPVARVIALEYGVAGSVFSWKGEAVAAEQLAGCLVHGRGASLCEGAQEKAIQWLSKRSAWICCKDGQQIE